MGDLAACTPVTVTSEDGAEMTACEHGGHVLGWIPAGGVQRLWLSPSAQCGPGQAIRGGIPVVFPQFAGRGPLPKHGVARDRAWTRSEPVSGSAGVGRWRAILTADESTRAIWPHDFELVLTASVHGQELQVELAVRNTGGVPWSFTAALHGYLAVRSPDAVLEGLGGMLAEDNAAAPTDNDEPPLVSLGAPGEPVGALIQRDVAVLGTAEPVALVDAVAGRTTLTADGFTDRVIWNPGRQHGLTDVPEGAEQGFVCVEAARLTPVTLAPGDRWLGRQTLRAEPVLPVSSIAQHGV